VYKNSVKNGHGVIYKSETMPSPSYAQPVHVCIYIYIYIHPLLPLYMFTCRMERQRQHLFQTYSDGQNFVVRGHLT